MASAAPDEEYIAYLGDDLLKQVSDALALRDKFLTADEQDENYPESWAFLSGMILTDPGRSEIADIYQPLMEAAQGILDSGAQELEEIENAGASALQASGDTAAKAAGMPFRVNVMDKTKFAISAVSDSEQLTDLKIAVWNYDPKFFESGDYITKLKPDGVEFQTVSEPFKYL